MVVDFDLLISNPQALLKKVAQALDLTFSSGSAGVKEYVSDFLDVKLRHTQFKFEDLRMDPAAPLDVINAYEVLFRIAHDEVNLDAPDVLELFGQLNDRLQTMSPAFNYINLLESNVAERDGQHHQLETKHHQLEKQNTELLAQMALIQNSVSWKITKPLRYIKREVVKFSGLINWKN